MGDYSEGYDTITLSIPVPPTPSPPHVVTFFQALWIQPLPVTQPSIIGHRVRVQNLATNEITYLDIGLQNTAVFYAEPGTEIQLEIASVDAVGPGPYSTPIVVTVNSLQDIDIPDDIITPSKLTEDLREEIDLAKISAIDALAQISNLDSVIDGALTEIDNAKQRVLGVETDLSDTKATEGKLEQVRQLLSGVATENKLEQARALLEAISTKDFATSSKQDALNIAVEDLKSELILVKSELANIKANQLSGDQKVGNGTHQNPGEFF
jgi:predicted  nucleic acid-binding Zn-ribbon protein